MSQALIWARTQIVPSYNITQWSDKIGCKRSTYDDYEKGKVTTPDEVLESIRVFRGLPPNWWVQAIPGSLTNETRKDYGRKDSEALAAVHSTPLVPIPNIGLLSQGSLGDTELQRSNEPIYLPSNISGPSHVAAIADQHDTGEGIPHLATLIFIRGKRGHVGRLVAFHHNDGYDTLRQVAWSEGRIVYRSLNNAPDLSSEDGQEEGLLVGIVYANRAGKFKVEYDEEGDLDLRF